MPNSSEDLEVILRTRYPSVFTTMLNDTGRTSEVKEFVETGEIFADNMTTYTEWVLKPYLKSIEDQLHQGNRF